MRSAASELRVEPASSAHTVELLALFERAGCPCHCRYWHFAGDKNAWQARCASEPERNRDELVAALERGAVEARGVVACTVGGQIVGWSKLAPAAAVPKLQRRRPYVGLPGYPGDREGVLVIGCLLVDPARRREGVSAALLAGAIAAGRAQGARAIEAFPYLASDVADEVLMMGPGSVYAAAGFQPIAGADPYPVLRLELG